MKKILKFPDLKFVETVPCHFEASVKLHNGYTFICRMGKGTATAIGAPYEIQILPIPKGDTYLSDDITGYLNKREVEVSLQEAQRLKNVSNGKMRKFISTILPKFDW